MASKSEAAQTMEAEAATRLMDSTLDEYVSVCASVASSIGFRLEEHEIYRRAAIFRGKFGGRDCVVVSPIPSLGIQTGLANVMRSAAKGGKQLILLSPFEESAALLRNKRIVASKTGEKFLAAAARTPAFRQLKYRLEKGENWTRSPGDRKYRDLIVYARERYDAGDYNAALETISSILAVEPMSDEAFRLQGNIQFKKGAYEKALLSFDSALNLNPRSVDNWFGRATALFTLGRFEEELKCYETILRVKPNHRGALKNKGATLQHIGRLKEATAVYEKLLRLKKNDTGVLKNLAIAKYALGDADGALVAIDAILTLDGDEPRALRMKGLILAEMGKTEAIGYLQRYASMEKDEEVLEVIDALRHRLAVESVHRQLEDYNEPDAVTTQQTAEDGSTIPEIEQAAAAPQAAAEETAQVGSETIVERMERNGLLSTEAGLLDALAVLKHVASDDARDAVSEILKKLNTLARQGTVSQKAISALEEWAFEDRRFADAEKLARKLCTVSNSRDGRIRLASALAMRERPAEALEALEGIESKYADAARSSLLLTMWRPSGAMKLIRDYPQNDSLFTNNRGVAVLEKKGPASAFDYYSERNWKNTAIFNNEGVCLLLDGDTAGGLELLDKCSSTARWQYSFNLGAALMEAGRTAEAERPLRSSIEMHPTGLSHNSLGIVLAEQKDYNGAKREFEAALSGYNKCEMARRNLRKLERVVARTE